MEKNKQFWLTAVIPAMVGAMLMASAPTYGSDFTPVTGSNYTVINFTDNAYNDLGSRINNSGQVVWSGNPDGLDGEIFLYDGISTIQLTNNSYADGSPDINDRGQVVWVGNDDTDREIFLYYNGVTTQLTDNAYHENSPRISNGGHVVWWGNNGTSNEIFLYYDGVTTQLTNNAYDDVAPQVNDSGQVVWEGRPDIPDNEIFLYDDGVTTRLTDNSYLDVSPQINRSGLVVWRGFDGTDSEVLLYDGNSTTPLTNNTFWDQVPQINDSGQVVWARLDGSPDYKVLLYDGGVTTQITSHAIHIRDLQINNSGQVVGLFHDGADYEIFFYDGASTIQLTDDAYWDEAPQINDSGQIVWFGFDDGADTEIFLAEPNHPPVADAGPDQVITLLNSGVFLDGTQSWDLEGDPITYSWWITSRPVGSRASLKDNTVASPVFVADVWGDYIIELVVSDLWASSTPDSVTVSFNNLPPVANAGGNQSVAVGDTVFLDGSNSSDANEDPLTYLWAFTSMPGGSNALLSNPTAVNLSFVADAAGTYEISLVVNDGLLGSTPAMVSVTATINQSGVIDTLGNLIGVINALDPGDFKNANMANALTNKINAVLAMIDAGLYQEALDKLVNDILPKTDGCAATGGTTPDRNDWIRDCAAQVPVYLLIVDAINFLKTLI